jgi:protein SCO1/2
MTELKASPRRTSLLLGSLLATGVLLTGAAACDRRPAPAAQTDAKAGASNRPDFGGDFTLTRHDGKPFRLADLRGKAVLLFFGYTFCPDMCPMTSARIMEAIGKLGDRRSQVVPLFVSLDPARDTPALIASYITHFGPDMIGLTGSPDEIARVARLYHVGYEKMPQADPANYLINHTTAIFLIDQQGALRDYFAYDEPTDSLAAAVQGVLNGT